MPHVSGSICGGLDRGRTFTPGRSQFAFVAAGPLRGRAALPGGKGRLDIFSKSLGQIQNLDPDHLMSALKSRTAPGDTLPRSAILLSTPGSKRWMSMVMADDENSDFVANDAEQKVIWEPSQIRSPDITLPD